MIHHIIIIHIVGIGLSVCDDQRHTAAPNWYPTFVTLKQAEHRRAQRLIRLICLPSGDTSCKPIWSITFCIAKSAVMIETKQGPISRPSSLISSWASPSDESLTDSKSKSSAKSSALPVSDSLTAIPLSFVGDLGVSESESFRWERWGSWWKLEVCSVDVKLAAYLAWRACFLRRLLGEKHI